MQGNEGDVWVRIDEDLHLHGLLPVDHGVGLSNGLDGSKRDIEIGHSVGELFSRINVAAVLGHGWCQTHNED